MSPYLFVFISFCVVSVFGDCYLQYPPGSNDRLDEESNTRNNANRLFDSQNNANGGYCKGPEVTWYAGSILPVEWTVQHSCGPESNAVCQIILQYMCSSDAEGADETLIIRDGLTTNTISTNADPNSADYYNRKAATGEFFYGMQEPLSFYQDCTTRERNKGLFTADQTLNGNTAQFTRQNNNGDRHGFECPEERDYHPYWHPTPWKDIAVLVDRESRCDIYRSESQNVKAKNYCTGTTTAAKRANNEAACSVAGGQWLAKPAWGIPAPDCFQAPFSRDNHLGNTRTGHQMGYNWTLPTASQEDCIENGNCTCVLRILYNITVGELNGDEDYLDSGLNSILTEDPTVVAAGANYTLAYDTAQTGRTFQDRSHMFRIAPRPDGIPNSAKIHNLSVRGRRGNIQEVYPGTEYDFVPTHLEVIKDDYIHFQWTGCDHNDPNNAGEGADGTDRSNIVQIADMTKNFPLNDTQLEHIKPLFRDAQTRARFANIDQVNCLNYEALQAIEDAGGPDVDQNPQNCMVLNQAGPRFSGAAIQMTVTGTYFYMSTRNNNFSNRSQKASIKVHDKDYTGVIIGATIGGFFAIAGGACAGTILYAKRHPMSKAAQFVRRIIPWGGDRI